MVAVANKLLTSCHLRRFSFIKASRALCFILIWLASTQSCVPILPSFRSAVDNIDAVGEFFSLQIIEEKAIGKYEIARDPRVPHRGNILAPNENEVKIAVSCSRSMQDGH